VSPSWSVAAVVSVNKAGALFAFSLFVASLTAACQTGVGDASQSTKPSESPSSNEAGDVVAQFAEHVNLDCETDGCLRSVTFLGAWGLTELQAYEENNQTIDNGYSVWQAYYATQNRYARVTVTVPDVEPRDPDGFSVVVNNPGTVGVAWHCAPGFSAYGTGLAGTFGARGYVGAAVDYPGLGSDGVHPYLVKESEGKASLDGLRATRHLMALLDIPLKDKDAIVGLSQGGHATLAAAELHATYAPELPIMGFGAVAPSSLYREQWTPYLQYEGPHMVFNALVNYAWHQHYNIDDTDSWAEGKRDEMVALLNNHCLFDMEGNGLYDVLPMVPTEIFSQELIDAFTQDDLSEFPAFRQGFEDNRLVGFESNASLKVFQGTLDELVPLSASDQLVTDLQAAGTDIDLVVVEGGTHADTCFGMLGYVQTGNPLCFAWLDDILSP